MFLWAIPKTVICVQRLSLFSLMDYSTQKLIIGERLLLQLGLEIQRQTFCCWSKWVAPFATANIVSVTQHLTLSSSINMSKFVAQGEIFTFLCIHSFVRYDAITILPVQKSGTKLDLKNSKGNISAPSHKILVSLYQ